jgi:hypothetical protein
MPRVRDLLYRFRPAGTPGSAGVAGVPVDHAADLAAELGPLFAQLAPTEAACAQIIAQAGHDAAAITENCRWQASELLRAARAGVDIQRTEAAARARHVSDAIRADALATAQYEAAATLARAELNMARYVDLITESVRHRVGGRTSLHDSAGVT